MANEIPSFLAPATHKATIAGRELTFFPVSAQVMFRLRAVSGPLAKVIDAFVSGQEFEHRQKALAELLEAVGANGELAALLVLDALHEEDWVKRPITSQAASAFFAKVDGPTLVGMLLAVAKVNGDAFGPFVQELVTGLTHGVRNVTSGLQQQIQSASGAR